MFQSYLRKANKRKASSYWLTKEFWCTRRTIKSLRMTFTSMRKNQESTCLPSIVSKVMTATIKFSTMQSSSNTIMIPWWRSSFTSNKTMLFSLTKASSEENLTTPMNNNVIKINFISQSFVSTNLNPKKNSNKCWVKKNLPTKSLNFANVLESGLSKRPSVCGVSAKNLSKTSKTSSSKSRMTTTFNCNLKTSSKRNLTIWLSLPQSKPNKLLGSRNSL